MRRLIWVFAGRSYHIVENLMSRLICGRLFSRRDDARGIWRLAQVVITSWRNVIRIVTSRHGDHTAACLKELSLTFKLLVIDKFLSLMVKIQVKYQQNWHLCYSLLLFCFFSMSMMNKALFFKGRIRFLVRTNRLRIDTGTLFWQNKNQAFI